MKSRNRPPLNLTDPEPPAENVLDVPPMAEAETGAVQPEAFPEAESQTEPQPTPTPTPTSPPERPMSERRRRRLAEERQQAEEAERQEKERAEAMREIAKAMVEPEAAPELAVAAGAPPVKADTLSPAPASTAMATARMSAPNAKGIGLASGVAAALWIAGVAAWAAYEIGSGAVSPEALRIAVYVLIALAPAGLALLLAQALRQGIGLAAETRRAHDLSQALLAPTALAAQQTGQVLQALRQDIDHASVAAERARTDMALLRETLVEETRRLNEAAETAGRTARLLTEQLAAEREQMTALSGALNIQATGVMDAVERQSQMVVDASDLAQTQLREAEAALAARAADLAAAAGEAQDAARLAAEDLARQTLRLENAGAGVAEQIQSVEEGLGQQRAALVSAALGLRTDQEDFSAQVESQRAQLIEQLSATRSATGELGQASLASSQTLQDLVEAASDQFKALVDLSQREADSFDAQTKLALDRFEALGGQARDTLAEETRRVMAELKAVAEESRAAAAEAAEQAQIRADRLGEALFDAAQKADDAAEARIASARRIAADTAGMVDEAGQKALAAMEATVERMADAFDRIDGAMRELDLRSANLPGEAQARVEAVRASVEEGLAALSAASRKAAEDTEALEAGFQDRVRRNYDMLTEAVRLMGVVSGDSLPPRRRDAPVIEAPQPAPERRRAETSDRRERTEREEPADDRGFGLRGRLRLEPTPVAPPPGRERLDWNDLDDRPGEVPLDLDTPAMPAARHAELSERIIGAIRRMGVDPNALLPRARVEEAAQALAGRDPDRARQIVRRVAPAAVRSVSRRVLTDPDLRADAEAYVRATAAELRETGYSGDASAVLAKLTSDGGRAFMLLDAAIGDLA